MTSVVVFILVCYSIAFLIADANIFGCGTVAYNEDPDDGEFIWSKGVVKFRPNLFTSRFFRELFTCYICQGKWVGPLAHTLMYYAVGARYWFYHVNTQQQWLLGCVLASMVSATGCYLTNTLLERLSLDTEDKPPLTIYEEIDRGNP